MMWVSLWALRKQVSLENYAHVKYPASIYEPYSCTTPEAIEELHCKYLLTQRKVFLNVWKMFQGKRIKYEAFIWALGSLCDGNELALPEVQGDNIEKAAENLLAQLKYKVLELGKQDGRDELQKKLREHELQLCAAQEENQTLKMELKKLSMEYFGTETPLGQSQEQKTVIDPNQKDRLVAVLVSPEILKSHRSLCTGSYGASILGSDLDADFLVR